jgi:hypothetical protein
MITDVKLPAGVRIDASVANNVLLGTRDGGGGVQFQIKLLKEDLPPTWFTNERALP